jgi:hypothetical protein
MQKNVSHLSFSVLPRSHRVLIGASVLDSRSSRSISLALAVDFAGKSSLLDVWVHSNVSEWSHTAQLVLDFFRHR